MNGSHRPVAAVPEYLGQDFSDTPPGHRFTLYGRFWERDNGWKRVKNVIPKEHLKPDFDAICPSTMRLAAAVRARQAALVQAQGEAAIIRDSVSIAPLAAGTGIEHPLENGMAFLNPYGLPYLPGSSVKGVLRRAAEELRDDIFGEGDGGWSQPIIDALFGPDADDNQDTELTRGALIFWDVIPACNGLRVDIMNPHYSGYYQGNASPADCESPRPIYFLTIPQSSVFTFHIQCVPALIRNPELRKQWPALIDAALAHAFDWLGFGAKTAVGYGHMALDHSVNEAREQQRAAAERARQDAELGPEGRAIRDLQELFDKQKAQGISQSSSPLADKLATAVKQARGDGWSLQTRHQLAEVGEKVVAFLEYSKKKKREKKAELAALRERSSS